MFLILVLVGIVSALLWYLHRKLRFWQRQGVPTPGLLYQWHYYRRQLALYDQELMTQLGPTYGTYEGLTPILILGDPDLIRDVLVKDFASFPNHKPMKVGIPIIDQSLFSLEGNEDWKRIRGIISPTFTSGKLRAMSPIASEAILNFTSSHLSRAAEIGEPINVRKYFNAVAMDVIVRCAYGQRVYILSDPENPISKTLENLFKPTWQTFVYLASPKLAAWLGQVENATGGFRFFENLTKTLIEERIDAQRSSSSSRVDFVQLMLEAKEEAEKLGDGQQSTTTSTLSKTMSTIEMMAQALVFLIAGFDTSSTTMACCAYHLASHPEVQDQLIAEVKSLPDMTTLSHENVGQLKYLDAVLKESLRMTSPIIRIERQCVAATMVGRIKVEPGTIVSIPTFALQRDPRQFSNPEVFDPRRFLEGGADLKHHPYAFLPFGGGPRMCIGQRFAIMEVKMTLAQIMNKFRFELVPETKLQFTPVSFDLLAPMEIMLKVKEHC